ncbi:phosphonate C-P lyase system protein PhnG [Xanthobacteraceae bacterium Astr-EGSB]|uniref:phosphonate C-P lyase system protein PhnG n=1 Tax=Astrobacterium formosum TaxID=3069710 RepID=UPI0027B73B18|nr:phosphonate C-P lyase system protein PhnG [Xanthobacteraceae bacterium Astr-EGSB]
MTTPASSPHGAEVKARRAAMATLAHADAHELADRLALLPTLPGSEDLRPAEIGLVMLRGRIGGDGAPFNLGEATVTRAAVRLLSGEIGHSYVLGRAPEKARLAAVCDALWQHPGYRTRIENDVLAPIRARLEGERSRRRAQTAATKVEFFTMLRGED